MSVNVKEGPSARLARQMIGRANASAPAQERKRVMALPHPDRQPAPTPGMERDMKDLARAEEALRATREAKGPRSRRRHLEVLIATIARRVEAARRDQLDRAYAADAVAESVTLAVSRGEEVAEVETEVSDWARDEHGAMLRVRGKPTLKTEKARAARMVSRAGLAIAWERGALDGGSVSGDRLYEVGKKYRRCVEKAEGRRTPNRDGPKVDCDVQVDPGRDYRAEAARDLAAMRAGLTPMERQVLDLVCGLDHSVGGTARVLGLHSRKVEEALRTGLHKAGEELLWW